MTHLGQFMCLVGALQNGACMVQPTKIPFSSDELLDMIARCGFNRLGMYSTHLAVHLSNSRQNPKVLEALVGLDSVAYSGMPLTREDEDWVYQVGLKIRNAFGSTECCGGTLASIGGTGDDARYMYPLPGMSYGFIPISGQDDTRTEKLLELVILSDSPDCPDAAHRSADGHYHTGDLFVEVAPGKYLPRGRDDDWIRTYGRCDTGAIEESVRSKCGDLISECVVVGNSRPSPSLFVERRTEDVDDEGLKREIVARMSQFFSTMFPYEQIVSTRYVFVVPAGSLPRTSTKGNIRRRAVEERYKEVLDAAYGKVDVVKL